MEQHKDKTILLIGPDEYFIKAVGDLLTEAGYITAYTNNVPDAIASLHKIHPPLIIIDIEIAEERSFKKLMRVMQDQQHIATPLIVITDGTEKYDALIVGDLRAEMVLMKPVFDYVNLLSAVTTYVGHLNEGSKAAILKSRQVLNTHPKSPRKVTVQKPEAPKSESVKRTGKEHLKVAIVEDDIFLRDMISEQLLKDGFSVLMTEGVDAFSLIVKEKPAAVLLDILMPNVNGFEILAKLKEEKSTADIPVIVFSNLEGQADVDKVRKLGASDFLVKANSSLDELSKKIFSVINTRTKNDQSVSE